MSTPNPLQSILGSLGQPPAQAPNPNALPQQQEQSPEQQKKDSIWTDIQKQELDALQEFSVARTYLQTLVKAWEEEVNITDANRLTRDIEVDVDILRENGDLEDDECIIPDRIIDSNIQREMPSYINFLKNSRRLAIFTDNIDPTFDTQLLEADFTRAMTYKGWIKPWYKLLDGGMTHAWASFEVMYDESKPGHVATEYIAHEDLLFPHDSKDIQASSCILRRYHVTALQLKAWCVNRGFDITQVELIIQKYEEAASKDKTIEVFKRFSKFDGVVYVAWFSLDGAAVDWLKQPAKLYCGIDNSVMQTVTTPTPIPLPNGQTATLPIPQQQQTWQKVDVNNYPIFIYFYRESEKPYLFDRLGRVTLDRDKQSANTAILTSFVNGCNRAMKIYASPAADTVNDGKPAKQLANIKWANGGIFDKPMVFWNMPYPDAMLLKALEYFDTSNSQDIGQTDFAAQNRQDSRKTATEIKAASQQSQLLDSVDLTNFSEFCREVFSFAWQIVRSQALQNKIKFLQIKNPAPQQPQMGSGALPMQQAPQAQPPQPSIVDSAGTYQDELSTYINDTDSLIRDFDVRAAGDVDVIQREEMEQSMMSDWPVISNTPLASRFLCDLIKLKYPEDGEIYSSILQAGDPRNIIMSLGTIVQALVALPEVKQHLTPQMMMQLQRVEQQAMAVLQPPPATPQGSSQANKPNSPKQLIQGSHQSQAPQPNSNSNTQ